MNTKKIYTASDFNPMSWAEFGEILSSLTERVVALNKTLKTPIDAIVPVLRSGAIPGYPVSIATGIKKIAPISVVRGTPSLSADATTLLATAHHALLCEVSVVTGKTAKNLSAALAKEIPSLQLSLLAVTWDFKTEEKIQHISNILIGTKTDERHRASQDEITALALRRGVPLMPWEDLDLELKEINS